MEEKTNCKVNPEKSFQANYKDHTRSRKAEDLEVRRFTDLWDIRRYGNYKVSRIFRRTMGLWFASFKYCLRGQKFSKFKGFQISWIPGGRGVTRLPK